jgi:hypothetical protein
MRAKTVQPKSAHWRERGEFPAQTTITPTNQTMKKQAKQPTRLKLNKEILRDLTARDANAGQVKGGGRKTFNHKCIWP